MQALGLIETRGLLPAIECADIMLKTAQVELVGRTLVGGGFVTIIITGDVGAIKAAVEAGATAVEKLGHLSLVSQHIIPRPHHEIESIVVQRAKLIVEQPVPVPQPEQSSFRPESDPTANINDLVSNQNPAPESVEVDKTTTGSTNSAQITLKQLHKEGVDAFVQEFGLEKSVNALKALSVVKLRNLAREYQDLGVAGRAISKANKDLLIQKLKGYYERKYEK